MNSSTWSCSHRNNNNNIISPIALWNYQCLLCQFGGIIILLLSIICLKFNIRYFIWFYHESGRNLLVLSLFIASVLVLTISVPGVVLKLLTSHQQCHEIYCRLEGFTSYFSGCLCMLVYMMLSLQQYLLINQHNISLFEQYSVSLCWIFSFLWTFPPVFNYWISYAPEGIGFHCSINWNNYSTSSFYYLLFSFVGVYFLPLIILIFINLRVHRLIRNIDSFRVFYYSNNQTSLSKQDKYLSYQEIASQRRLTISYLRRAAIRKRLRIGYRFIRGIIFLLAAYIFAWTPYAILAVLQLLQIKFIFRHVILITLAAFLAKSFIISMPMVYFYIMNYRLFKQILFH